MVWSARLSCRSPDLFSRCRVGGGPRGRLDGCDTAELGEGGLGTDPAVMGPGGDELTGHYWADPQLVEELGGEPADQPVELHLELGGLPLAAECPAGGGPHRHDGGGLLHASV